MARKLVVKIPDGTDLLEMIESFMTPEGKEIPSNAKRFIETSERPPTLKEQVMRIMADSQLRQQFEKHGFESIEDANDFEIEDEPSEPLSGYEIPEMEEETPAVIDNTQDVVPEPVEDPDAGNASEEPPQV